MIARGLGGFSDILLPQGLKQSLDNFSPTIVDTIDQIDSNYGWPIGAGALVIGLILILKR